MGKEISWDIRERAEELYIVEGVIFEKVSLETGVSVSQLKRWAADGDWVERRREYRRAFSDIKRDTVLLRKRLVEKALKSLNPQDVYALSSLESTVARIQNKSNSESQEPVKITKEIQSPGDAVDALQEAIELRVNSMLSKPGTINLSGIKEMKQAIELLEKMKARYKPEDETQDKASGLSDEAAEQIRKQILGIS